MSGQEGEESKAERILVICVDRDNDVGRKAGVKTPIIGKKENIDAALKLILADPEEADANAMFEAVRICNSLERGGTNNVLCQVATITGSELGGIAADRKLISELNEALKEFKPTSLILVTDGFSDEDIMPLIQSRVPVSSVRRVIVKHSETIEETAAIFSRYLRKIIEDPRYSRIFMGLPGILLIIFGILSFLAVFIRYDIGTWAWIIGLIIVGSYLFGKGYGLDKKISLFLRASSPYRLVTGSSLVFGILLIAVSLYQALSQIASNPDLIPSPLPSDPNVWLSLMPRIAGLVISTSITVVIIGVCIILIGRALGHLLERDQRFWRTLVFLAVCAWSWKIFNEAANILIDPSIPIDGLILSIIIGIGVAAVSVPIVHFASKKYKGFFKEDVKVEEEKREDLGEDEKS
jgi:putative membrane protein